MPDYTPDESINGVFLDSRKLECAVYRFTVERGVIVEADWATANSHQVAKEIGGRSWWLPGLYAGWSVRWSVANDGSALARFRKGETGGTVDILEGMEYLYPVESEA